MSTNCPVCPQTKKNGCLFLRKPKFEHFSRSLIIIICCFYIHLNTFQSCIRLIRKKKETRDAKNDLQIIKAFSIQQHQTIYHIICFDAIVDCNFLMTQSIGASKSLSSKHQSVYRNHFIEFRLWMTKNINGPKKCFSISWISNLRSRNFKLADEPWTVSEQFVSILNIIIICLGIRIHLIIVFRAPSQSQFSLSLCIYARYAMFKWILVNVLHFEIWNGVYILRKRLFTQYHVSQRIFAFVFPHFLSFYLFCAFCLNSIDCPCVNQYIFFQSKCPTNTMVEIVMAIPFREQKAFLIYKKKLYA